MVACTGQRRAILIILLSFAVRFLWTLDANLLLLVYDTYVARIAHGITDVGRRTFRPGSTSLEGKTIWITGSSSGIGAELAVQLASAGVGHLILSGRRREKLESVAESCRGASSEMRSGSSAWDDNRGTIRVSVVPFDMSAGPKILDKAVSTALRAAEPSGIDIIVLNAGKYQCSPALETDLDAALPDLMEVNFASPVQLSQKLIQQDGWKERKSGHIVVIASLMGRGPSALNAVYSATKHALRGYFHSLAAEERSWLRVNVVLPGATDTGLWKGSLNTKTAPKSGIASGGTEEHDNSKNAQMLPHADDRSKMSVGRCAQLIISSMIGPNFLFFETWISGNPGLLWAYLVSYEPMTFQLLSNTVSPLRMIIWRRNGEDALYLPTLLRQLWECVMDYISGRSERLLP